MLGDEDGMAAHRRLATVICRLGRRQSVGDKTRGMRHDLVQAARVKHAGIACRERHTLTKRRALECCEHRVQITHCRG